jgi:glycosyltransferase involved in cell wall biosynthesis
MRRLRVLQFICPSGFYGAEMWVLALAKGLPRGRAECHLAITREAEDQDFELYRRYRTLGLPSHQIPMNGRFDVRGIFRLCRLVRDQKIDIIHTHGYKSDILGLISARLSGIKCLATPHGFENAPDRKLQFFIWLGCKALKHIDFVAPLSEDLRNNILQIGVKEGRIKFIKNGVDLDEIKTLDTNDAPEDVSGKSGEKLIGYVGQLIHRKNVSALLRTFDLLYQENQNIRLLIVGDGKLRLQLEKEADSLRSAEKIQFLGFRTDRLAIMKQLDLFCMTSSLEGIPRCMMEAMALGTPVAAFGIPGVDQLIEDGETGLLANFGDLMALKDAWKKILFEPDVGKRLARKGQERIERQFSSSRMAEEYLDLYYSMVESRVFSRHEAFERNKT